MLRAKVSTWRLEKPKQVPQGQRPFQMTGFNFDQSPECFNHGCIDCYGAALLQWRPKAKQNQLGIRGFAALGVRRHFSYQRSKTKAGSSGPTPFGMTIFKMTIL